MFSFHSLAPVKLYAGSAKTPAPKSDAVMGDVQSSVAANGYATKPQGDDYTQRTKLAPQGDDAVTQKSEEDGLGRLSHEPNDSGVGSTIGSHDDISHTDHETHAGQESGVVRTATKPHEHVPVSLRAAAAQEASSPTSHSQPVDTERLENRTASIDFTNHTPAQAGPSQPRAGSSHSSLQRDAALTSPAAAAPPRPDETHFNAIAYRRDPETVIAYLVPLPQPALQGSAAATAPPKYFLYAPPPPHLLKPRHGSEGYARKLTRHWQQQQRRAKRNAHNGKRVSAHGIHSKLVRGCAWGMQKLQYDDVTFLARIHPTTVTHLILIHPWGLAGAQTPEEVMRTFRAQMLESKKRAKRNSIISAVFFLPALVIDTAAIFFGGMAEVDGIWMLVSITAYRTARFITRKMGPEPKTMELEQAKLIEDAKRSGFPPPEPEVEEENEPGAVRKSVDALRRSLGSVRYRMNMSQRRTRSKRSKAGEASSSDTSRPQTTEASRSDLEGFTGGELEHHVEEEHEAPTVARGVQAAAPPSTAHSGSELSGFLEHMDEEIPEDQQPGSNGAVLGGDPGVHRASAETTDSSKAKKKAQNFQLTFYPSPAMEVLARYVQEICHMKNGRAYSSPGSVPTEDDVLAVVGWHPERREHDTPEEQANDEEWQTREIKDDLRQASRKAAKAWNKSCRKQAKKQRGSKKGGLLAFVRRPAKTPKGKENEASASNEPPQSEKKARSEAIKARIASVRARAQRKQQQQSADDTAADTTTDDDTQEANAAKVKKDKRGRAAGVAALLCVPCLTMAERVKQRRQKTSQGGTSTTPPAPSEKGARRGALKQRLSSKRDALRSRRRASQPAEEEGAEEGGAANIHAAPVGMETPTDIDGPLTDTEGHTSAVATDIEEQTDREDNATQPKKQSAKGRLLAIPAAIVAAIGAVLKKRRDGKTKNKTTKSSSPKAKQEKKASRLSALQERFKARRTRVKKTDSGTTKPGRLSGLKDWFRELNQKRKAKRTAKTTPAKKASQKDKPETAKEHGAIVGLVAGCVALPVAKAKQVRDNRRRKTAQPLKPTTTDAPASMVTGTPLSPVEEEHQQRAATSGSSTLAPSTAGADRPSTSYRAPVVQEQQEEEEEEEEEYEDPPEELPIASQYLPGHGQSEVPVRPGPPDARLGSSDTAVEQTVATAEPQQSKAQATNSRLKAARAGVVGFASRRRATGDEAGEAKVEKTGDSARVESAPSGRFQGFKDGLEGFKAKRRAADSTQTDAAVEDDKAKPAPDGDAPGAGGRFKTLKGGLANMKAKKNGTEPPAPNEKAYKDKTPGFIERLRWVWLVA